MNKEIPLSISPLRKEQCYTFSVQGAGQTLQKGDAILQFPPRVGVGDVGLRSSSRTPAPAVGPEGSPSKILFP